jgi:hypothetical protein
MAVTGTNNVSVSITDITTKDLGRATDTNAVTYNKQITDGVGENQMNLIWSDTRSLNATASEDLDLAGGLTSGLGATLTFARVKELAIVNNTTTAGFFLEVGGAASNAWSTPFGSTNDVIKVAPGGCLKLSAPSAAGYAVTAGTADILKINNPNASSISYSILIGGANA